MNKEDILYTDHNLRHAYEEALRDAERDTDLVPFPFDLFMAGVKYQQQEIHSALEYIYQCWVQGSGDDMEAQETLLKAGRIHEEDLIEGNRPFPTDYVARIKQLEQEIDRLKAERNKILNMDSPFPVWVIVREMCDAADTLLNDFDYDGHGYEGIIYAKDAGREYVKNLGIEPQEEKVFTEEKNMNENAVLRLCDALIWMSGAEDFQEGGKARKGFLKIAKPLLDEFYKPKNQAKDK